MVSKQYFINDMYTLYGSNNSIGYCFKISFWFSIYENWVAKCLGVPPQNQLFKQKHNLHFNGFLFDGNLLWIKHVLMHNHLHFSCKDIWKGNQLFDHSKIAIKRWGQTTVILKVNGTCVYGS